MAKKIEPGRIVVTHSGNVYEISHNGGEEGVRNKQWWNGECLEVGPNEPHHKPGGRYLVHESSCVHVFTLNEYEVWILGRAFKQQ